MNYIEEHNLFTAFLKDILLNMLYQIVLGKVRFFLGGRAGASEGRVISESEH